MSVSNSTHESAGMLQQPDVEFTVELLLDFAGQCKIFA